MPTSPLVFNVAAAGQPERPLEMVGHLFDARGRLIASAPVTNGRLAFDVDPARLSRASLYVAPVDPEGAAPTVAVMKRLAAYQPTVALRPGPAAIAVKIPEDLWKRWLFCVTRVVGRVVRPVEIGGEIHELPVCHARVHICEVDPWPDIFTRIPDPKILRLRDELLHLVERVPRPPIPDPGPLIRPRVPVRVVRPAIDARLLREIEAETPMIRVGAVSEASEAVPFASLMSAAELHTLAATREAAGVDLAAMSAIRLEVPAALRNALSSPSASVIRNALAANTEVLMPALCWWPWVWPFVRYDEVKVVETDEHGRFEANILYPCNGDKPDVYAWVEYCIGGTWTAVLKPPAACATHWNYASGSELVLRVRDPRVPWCEEPPTLPGKKVGVLTLGNAINVHQVDQGSGLVPGGRPMGGSIEPTVWFGQQLQAGIGASHYKWSYRRVNPDKSPVEDWIACDEREVGRHYGVIGADSKIHFKSYKLGPDEAVSGDSLFKIPPKDPPAGSWAPQLNARANTASAYLWSGSRTEYARIPDGLYELKLELFQVSGGTITRVKDVDFEIPPSNVAAPFPTDTDLTLVNAPEAYLIREG
ncbi:MAG: hypothetical protein KC420_13255, partial [Myxococcales bacterium]|nr:hypothetical protein [Myxococcales bacterium]